MMADNKQATILIYLVQGILNIELFKVANAKKWQMSGVIDCELP